MFAFSSVSRHTIIRTARGRVDDVRSYCDADDCPVEDADPDAGTITYRCPLNGDELAVVDTDPRDDVPADQPATSDELKARNRRRR